MKIKKAIILCAGFGKRMRPLTKKIPKPLIKIKGVTLLEKSIQFLKSLGIKHIIINSHHLHKEIVKFTKRKKFKLKLNVVIEKDKILNTGGGILNASKKFKKRAFLVLKPDTKATMIDSALLIPRVCPASSIVCNSCKMNVFICSNRRVDSSLGSELLSVLFWCIRG